MKKKLPSAKAPLPKFKTERAEAEYFGNHSVAGLWDQLQKAKPAKLSAALEEKIRDRHARHSLKLIK